MELPPLIQAPMAGVSTPALAAAVSDAGGLGSIAVGHLDTESARAQIEATRNLTGRPFGVNVFCHRPAAAEPEREQQWLRRLEPEFAQYGARPPAQLEEIYASFTGNAAMLAVVVQSRPAVVSFHFGLPEDDAVRELREAGCYLLATVTSLEEARLAGAAGVDAIVAQGYEAGGHRGQFDPDAPDACLSTLALTRLLVRRQELPVVAAGGLMDGAGIGAVLRLGACAAQLGTAYVPCPESSAGYKDRLSGADTVMTRNISGRPARSLRNRFTEIDGPERVPAYPRAYHAGKALHAAALRQGESGYGAHWAGQGAALARALPAGELTRLLLQELQS
jgi:nitronate monooxygenase